MKLVKKAAAAVKRVLTRARILHYLDIFLAAFVVELGSNDLHLLGAHGLDAWKAAVIAAAIAGGKAAFEAYRKSLPAGSSAVVAAAEKIILAIDGNQVAQVTSASTSGTPEK